VPLGIDSDGDGYADFIEVALGKNPNVYCPIMRADVDYDGEVSILDLTIVGKQWQENVPPANPRYDQDGDGKISIIDLTIMGKLFTQTVLACP
jgi:hypothetical protein